MKEIVLFSNLSNLLLTLFAVSVTSACDSLVLEMPAAKFVMQEIDEASIFSDAANIAS